MNLSVTIDRTGLSLSDLVIDDDPTSGDYFLDEDTVERLRPEFKIRRAYAPDSAWVGGRQLLAAVAEASALPLTFYVQASTQEALEAAVAVAETAFGQFAYDLTVDLRGQTRTWAADPELPSWFADSGMLRAGLLRGSIVIPLNPA